MTLLRSLFLVALFLTGILYSGVSNAEDKNPDVLWDIVSNCLDPSRPDYCKDCGWPVAGTCLCERTTEIWEKTAEYVAVRDVKMCGCPSGFIHGIVLPRKKVTGVEDRNRPNDIWQFAWDIAEEKGVVPWDIALAVNSAACRGQNQLHVHIARLNHDGQEISGNNSSASVENLNQVWDKARELAMNTGLSDYGILVKQKQKGRGFLVVINTGCPEETYTEYKCR
jgi:CDP-diacylglycerol pyrophosphatase